MKEKYIKAKAFQLTSLAYEQKNNYAKSLYYLRLKNKVENDLSLKDNATKIAEMNALYEIEEKDLVEKIKQISSDDDLEKLFDEYLKGQDLNN